MPQLDKYIFLNQILSLTIFFLLLYIYIRNTIVPTISKLLKYRRKKLNLLFKKATGYNKVNKFIKIFNKINGLTYTNIVINKINKMHNYYQNFANKQILYYKYKI